MRLSFLIKITLFLFCLLIFPIVAFSATLNSFSISAKTVAITCLASEFQYVWNFTAVNDDDRGSDATGITITDGRGVVVSTYWFVYSVGSTGPSHLHYGVFGNGVMNDMTARPLTITIYDLTAFPPGGVNTQPIYDNIVAQNAPVLAQYIYDPATDVPACASLPYITRVSDSPNECPYFYDGRINNCDTGNLIVVYGHDYGGGQGLLITDTEGNNLLQVTAEQIAIVPECPDVNTMIASGGAVSVYRLAGSCEYQVNGPASDAKTYVLNFSTLNPDSGYSSHEE